MGNMLRADLDAIRGLSDKQHLSARDVRAIDVGPVFAPASAGLIGSDTAAQLSAATEKITSALSEVAGRIDTLAQTNRQAADTIGIADDTYAHNIKATLNLAP
ncbi:hypothetical protein [Williamsia maris]|uniref:Excreted virulence factor EspC (Type VII ESX diderm) n=1 Tax=Williamsia maris TaxID=72806 RepID=A0ABT1HJJ0_9NOCA|nr:hypothetical protein [Williamsia maris]MCP2178112.1 hypothetical protein [Williamsia maris]